MEMRKVWDAELTDERRTIATCYSKDDAERLADLLRESGARPSVVSGSAPMIGTVEPRGRDGEGSSLDDEAGDAREASAQIERERRSRTSSCAVTERPPRREDLA